MTELDEGSAAFARKSKKPALFRCSFSFFSGLSISFAVAAFGLRLQIFTGFKANRFAKRNRHFFARPRIAPDASFSGLDGKNTESPQLDSLTVCQSVFHRVEEGFNHLLRLLFRNSRLRQAINNIKFYHFALISNKIFRRRFVSSRIATFYSDDREQPKECQE